MRYFDLIGQTILLLAIGIMAIKMGFYGVMIGAFFLGTWQMISSLFSLWSNSALSKWKSIHLFTASVYLGLLPVIFGMNASASAKIISYLMLVVPAALAIYYYIITCRWAFAETKRSKFLPNISF